uniref:Autophagy protein 5 n=1 Tax=Tetradesmus obliquus TaxID=3088 RepID=A0A383VVF5_TETOB|eukprot:jgi/Sobl393_1/13252/SZX68829.1
MTAEDPWQLKIPIRLCLSSSEITSPVDVKPVYLLAPRYAYLPALAEQCLQLFQHVLLSLPGQAEPSPWFEHAGLPLNWTQPLGVLHDLLAPRLLQPAPGGSQQQQQACSLSAPAAPWCLTVHYRDMPALLSNSWQNAGTAKDYFFSSLKEAGYCCRGSEGCGAVMRLPGQAQDKLWAAVNKGDGAAARRITAPLRLIATAVSSNSSSSSSSGFWLQRQPAAVATVPVRLFIRTHSAQCSSQDLAAVWEQTYSSSRPVEVLQPDGSPTLLAHLVHAVLPQQFPAPVPPAAAAAMPQPTAQQQQQQGSEQQLELPVSQATAAVSEQQQQQQDTAEAVDPLGAASDAAVEPAAGGVDVGSSGSKAPAAASEGNSGSAEAEPGSNAAGDAAAAATVAADRQTSDVAGSSAASREGAAPAAAAAVAATAPSHELPDGWPASDAAVFVCGVQPDWCTPLAWLHANLKAADSFLYIVVHLLM